jgi:glutamate-1-semialdehyde 2,1-aminomutase
MVTAFGRCEPCSCRKCLPSGILTLGTHNLSYAHGEAELQALFAAYDHVLPLIRTAVREKKLEQMLKCPPLEPLFKVR